MALCFRVNIMKFLEYYSCISLRTTCFILGYLHLSFNSFDTLCLIAIAKFSDSLQISDYSEIDFLVLVDQPDYSEIATFEYEKQLSDSEKSYKIRVGTLFIVVICVNMIWLLTSIACLVGLHLNKPGPIRTYVTFIASRVVILIAGFGYSILSHTVKPEYIGINLADIYVSINFVIVYYLYAVQLRNEIIQKKKINKFRDKGISTHKSKVHLQKNV